MLNPNAKLKVESYVMAILLITGILGQIGPISAFALLDDIVDKVEDVAEEVEDVVEEIEETVEELENTVDETVNDVTESVGNTANIANQEENNNSDYSYKDLVSKEKLSRILDEDYILELQLEKDKESSNQPKIDKKIKKLAKTDNPQDKATELGLDFKAGKVKVVFEITTDFQKTIEKVEKLGHIIQSNNRVQMYVDLDKIPTLNSIHGIKKVSPTFASVQYEYPKSEGVYYLGADIFHYTGYYGKGVKIAVLDHAFDTSNPKISDNIVESKSFRQSSSKYTIPVDGLAHESGHGTAVAEILTDVAPGSQLFLYSVETDVEFEAAVDEAITKNVDIIVMSAGWPNLPTDGSSSITKKVEEAISHDVLFVVPAGNFAKKHWEGKYVDSNLNGYHEFLSNDEGLTITVTQNRINEKTPIVSYLRWDVGLGDVADFDLILIDQLGNVVDYSSNSQETKDDEAFEYIHFIPKTEGLYALGVLYGGVIVSLDDVPKANMEIFTLNDEVEYPVKTGSVSVPTDAKGAIVVGAVNHLDGSPESFSSLGPTNDGKDVPHIMGPDGVKTVALKEPFYGTSATAPHIAGLAALITEKRNEPLHSQLFREIQSSESVLYWLDDYFKNAIGYGKVNPANWKLVYLQKDVCHLSGFEKTEAYHNLVKKYFDVYEFENNSSNPSCLSQEEYDANKFSDDLDLVILVYDDKLGSEILLQNQLDGFYTHFGSDRMDNHFIVMCDCSVYDSGYESRLPSWILSHELSHFIFSFKGYSQANIEKLVHEIDLGYENCVGKNFRNLDCDQIRLTINPNWSRDYIVMAPHSRTIGNYLVSYTDEVLSKPELVQQHQENTDLWLKGEINEEQFVTEVKNLIDPPKILHSDLETTINSNEGFMIAEVSKTKETNWQQVLVPDLFQKQKLGKLLDSLHSQSNIEDRSKQEIPNWFKTRALMWSEGKIGDKVYFDGIENLVRMGIIALN